MKDRKKKKLFRCATVHTSIDFIRGLAPYLSSHYELLLLSSPGHFLTEISEENGLRYYEVPMERRLAPFKDIISLFRLIRVFLKEKPDMVHSMTPKAGLLCMIAAWITRVPIRIHTFTGLVWPTQVGMKRHLLMTTDKITCACATHIVPEGYGVLNDLKTNGITSKSMKVLGFGNIQGVDLERFDRNRVKEKVLGIRDKYCLNEVLTFVFVGRVVGDKGINELVAAFTRLQKEYSDVKMLLIGRREDNDPISEETDAVIKKSKEILELGEIYGDELIAHYSAADVLVFPSYREGFPNTVLEAGALDLPCIVTDINGSREIIEDGKNGLIVPPREVAPLYHAMKYVIENPIQTKRMASNAREMIATRFDCHYVRQCLYDYYAELFEKLK